jgi:hypothetical protein
MSKVLIGIGDSFTQGQGGISLASETYRKYGDKIFNGVHHLPIERAEHEASWVNQICVKHLKEYTPLNFGNRGGGNRSSVKELYLRSDQIPDDVEDIIVIFMLSGKERFDFVQRGVELQSDHHFYTAFPNSTKKNPVWLAYSNHIHSDQASVVETIMNICEAETWCKANNAKLIVCSAFDTTITEQSFSDMLPKNKKWFSDLVNWDEFFRPEGYDTMLHMLIDRQENGSTEVERLKHGAYWNEYAGKFPCKEWVTPCCHPTNKGHKLIAKLLVDEILRRGYA